MVCRAFEGDAPILSHLLGEASLLPWLFDLPDQVPAQLPGAPTQSGAALRPPAVIKLRPCQCHYSSSVCALLT